MITALRPQVRHGRFRALGTYVHVATTANLDRAIALAEAVLAEVDTACSRFRADSDLSRANARAGQWTRVDPLLVAAVGVALEAARDTAGLVDPCLGRQLIEIGYDADLSVVTARRDSRPVPVAAAPREAWQEVRVDDDGAVFVPTGVQLDLGATAKAWAADLLAATLVDAFDGDTLVSLGGDIRILGRGGFDWPVLITEHPGGVGDDSPPEEILLQGGGLATSSTMVRRWVAGGVAQHHLLDPRSGRPVAPCWRTVTATGPTCVAANVATTAAIVLGPAALGWLAERGVDARLVDVDGRVRRTGRWPAGNESRRSE